MSQSSEYKASYNLIDLKRLAYILKALDASEKETLEILMDNDAIDIINHSIQECSEGKGVSIDQW
jgi:hypothetical protein